MNKLKALIRKWLGVPSREEVSEWIGREVLWISGELDQLENKIPDGVDADLSRLEEAIDCLQDSVADLEREVDSIDQ